MLSRSPRRWMLVMSLIWLVLAVRIGVALFRHESLAGDLALPTFALFMTSAVLGSGFYSRWLDRVDEGRSRRLQG